MTTNNDMTWDLVATKSPMELLKETIETVERCLDLIEADRMIAEKMYRHENKGE